MTVHEVSKLAGVSIRTLQYYDKIGLLHPTGYTDAGYRLYDDADLERLQHILLFRELEFPLKDIKAIINSPDFNRSKALEQQIELLERPTIVWDFHSLLLGVQMMFSFMLTDEKSSLKVCKHCGKAFVASRPNSVFCSGKCKNQYNVYKSRAKDKDNTN